MFYIFQPFFILCSSFYLQTYTDMQSSRVTSLCYISEFLKHILALLGCFDILHLYFVEQLTNISPSPCPLVSVNVIDHSSLSAHVLHIPTLLSSAALSTFSYVPKPSHSQNIRHPYFVNNQLTFPPSQCPLVSANAINHSSLSAYVLHILTLSILCSSFTFPYLPKPFPFTNILHPYFC